MENTPLPVYTLDTWQVKPGCEEAFVTGWADLIRWTLDAVPGPTQRQFMLLRDVEDRRRFMCPIAWERAAAIESWRALPGFRDRLAGLGDAITDCTLRTVAFAVKRDRPVPGPPRTIYTVNAWTVRPGHEERFIAGWIALMEWTLAAVPEIARTQFRLFRDVHEPNRFFCPFAWESVAAVNAWRAMPGFRVRLAALRQHLDDVALSTLEVVTHAP